MLLALLSTSVSNIIQVSICLTHLPELTPLSLFWGLADGLGKSSLGRETDYTDICTKCESWSLQKNPPFPFPASTAIFILLKSPPTPVLIIDRRWVAVSHQIYAFSIVFEICGRLLCSRTSVMSLPCSVTSALKNLVHFIKWQVASRDHYCSIELKVWHNCRHIHRRWKQVASLTQT